MKIIQCYCYWKLLIVVRGGVSVCSMSVCLMSVYSFRDHVSCSVTLWPVTGFFIEPGAVLAAIRPEDSLIFLFHSSGTIWSCLLFQVGVKDLNLCPCICAVTYLNQPIIYNFNSPVQRQSIILYRNAYEHMLKVQSCQVL